MKKKLIELLKTLKLVTDERVAEVEKELEKVGIKDDEPAPMPAPIDTSKITDPAMKAIVEGLVQQVTALNQSNKTLLSTLTQEQQDRAAAVKTQREQMEADNTRKVTELLAQAVKDQKITKAKEDWLKKFAERDLAAAAEWVKDAPVDKHATPPKQDPQNKGGEQKPERIAGPLGSVNQGVLAKVLENSQAAQN